MNVMIEFWGDNYQFSFGEIIGILEGEEIDYFIIEKDFPVIVLKVEKWEPLKRAGLIRRISKHISTSEEIPRISLELENFAVRAKKYRGISDKSPSHLERKIGKMIKGRVNLDSPDNIVRVAIVRKIHVGIELHIAHSPEFEKRRGKNLPVSYPITMHPRFARAMVNLARVKRGARILDPFCGTGTILIEAGLAGMIPYGSDIDEMMLSASEMNLKKFGIEAHLQLIDVGDIEGEYDAIVTDPPYGRSSSTGGERIYALYERAFKRFSELVDRVVISLPNERAIRIGKKYFTLKEVYPVRVHKSLTRYFSYFHI